MIIYWRQKERLKNFGDALSEVLARLFVPGGLEGKNCYLLIGSVLSRSWIRQALQAAEARGGEVIFWGCGWRGEPIEPDLLRRVQICSVRGPLTRDALNLEPGMALGDTGLLLPLVYRPKVETRYECTIIPHFRDPKLEQIMAAPGQYGADHAITPYVERFRDIKAFIDTIVASEFVLAGSLHAAVTAAAYGVPFAYYSDGHVDCPAKWEDFSASLGIPCSFARNAEEGRELHASSAPSLKLPPLLPILEAAPAPVRQEVLNNASTPPLPL